MTNQADFELAQRRIEERDRRRNVFYVWRTLLIILIMANLFGGGAIHGFLVPITALVGLITAFRGIQVYYESPRRSPSAHLVEQELNWLYGDNWRGSTSAHEYALAESRIRERRMERWRFALHLLVYIPINTSLVALVWTFINYNEPSGIWIAIFPAAWTIFLIRHAIVAFPTSGMLRRRERAAGRAMDLTLQEVQHVKRKRGEKPKQLVLGDDGELVEIPDTPDEKSKRNT